MTDAALLLSGADSSSRAGGRGRAVFVRVAWRNLWRRRLRTWMAAGGIAFAIFLASLMSFFQAGVYGSWIDTATGLVTGHIQVQHAAYFDDPKVGHALAGGTEMVRALTTAPGVVNVTARAEAFALVSVGERSFGALVMGVDPEREAAMFALPHHIREGEYLPRADSAFVGASLATNLAVELGDEIVALGSVKEGGVAALVMTVDGIFETGRAELDRSLLQAPIAAIQAAFELGDAVHRVVLETEDPNRTGDFRTVIESLVPADARVLDWNELLPEVGQGIQLDGILGQLMVALLMIVVAMSVVNSFIMAVFERTREFGMLIAIGMRPNAIIGMLTIEAACVWVLGAALGMAVCIATVLPLNAVGIPLAELTDVSFAQLMVPESLYPEISARGLLLAPAVMLAGTLVGVLVPALRVRRMHPVAALREEE